MILTVKQLRAALEGVSDDLEVIIRTQDYDTDDTFCGGIASVTVEVTHDEDDTPFLAIDCSNDPEDANEDE